MCCILLGIHHVEEHKVRCLRRLCMAGRSRLKLGLKSLMVYYYTFGLHGVIVISL